MLLSVDRHLVQTIVPGTRLPVMGIYSIFQASSSPSSNSHKGAVAIQQPYIRVIGLEDTNEASSRGPANFTPDEVSVINEGRDMWKVYLDLKVYVVALANCRDPLQRDQVYHPNRTMYEYCCLLALVILV